MASKIFFFLLLSLSLPPQTPHHPPLIFFAKADMNTIQKTCKSTKYYDLCLSSLKPKASTPSSDSPKGLALIMIGVAVSNATSTASYLSSQLLNAAATNDASLKRVLKECADKYKYAGDALGASAGDLAEEAYDYASLHVMAAADYPNACRNAFRRYPGLGYPTELARREEGLKRICDVVLGILDSLGWS